MVGRITFNQTSLSVQGNINRNGMEVDKLQRQLSSGKRIMKPSDAPVDITNAMELRTEIRQFKQFNRNGDDGLAYLAMVGTTLQSANDLFQAARERAIQGSNDTYTATERNYLKQEVKVMLDQMVALSNTSLRGDYIFSGTNTQVPPYDLRKGSESIDAVDTSGANPTDTFLNPGNVGTPIQLWDRTVSDSSTSTGQAPAKLLIPGTVKVPGFTEGTDFTVDHIQGTITFLAPGTDATNRAATPGGLQIEFEWIRRNEADLDGSVLREIETGVTPKLNTTASEAFGAPGQVSTWEAMIGVLEGLHNNEGAQVRQSISKIDQAFQRNLAAQSTNGARTNRFESTQGRNENKQIGATDLQSQLEDLDFAEAISKFMLQQSVYEASLRAGAKVIQPSLMNFL